MQKEGSPVTPRERRERVQAGDQKPQPAKSVAWMRGRTRAFLSLGDTQKKQKDQKTPVRKTPVWGESDEGQRSPNACAR